MNIFLKNKLLNLVTSFVCCTIVFVLALIIAGTVAQLVLAVLSIFVAGGFCLKTMQWFDEKYIQLNNDK